MGLRIALLMNLAPRKHGSMEDWLLAFCQEAARRGHQVDAYLRTPVLATLATQLRASGTRVLEDLEEFARHEVLHLSRRLAIYDLLHLNFVPARSRLALSAYTAWPARVLYMAHTDFLEPREGQARRLLHKALDHVTMLRVHSLAGVSEHVRHKEGRRFGLPPSRTRTLFNGVDTQRFRPPPRRASTGPVSLIAIANLVQYKGVHHLLRALARLRAQNLLLRVIGDGPEERALRELSAALGLQHQTEFLGLRNNVHELLAMSDICVQPSLAEAFGLTIAEAMASGCAVVATRVGGIPELIEHGRSGLLVPPGDEAALAIAIDRLIADRELRCQLGEAARQRVCERFELTNAARSHVAWCEEVAAGDAPGAEWLIAPAPARAWAPSNAP